MALGATMNQLAYSFLPKPRSAPYRIAESKVVGTSDSAIIAKMYAAYCKQLPADGTPGLYDGVSILPHRQEMIVMTEINGAKRPGKEYRGQTVVVSCEVKPTAFQVLLAARNLLSERERWNRLGGAWKKNGRYCSVFDPEAYSFCLLSALQKFSGPQDQSLNYQRKHSHDSQIYNLRWPIMEFELQASHSKLLQLLDRTLVLAKEMKS